MFDVWKPGHSLEDHEKTIILEALEFYCWNRSHTAEGLGITVRTVRNKIKQYRGLGIHIPECAA